MDEEVIDRVAASTLEVGDRIIDPDSGTVREISGVFDDGWEFHVLFEDDEDITFFHPDEYVDVYGYPIVEV